MSDYALTKRQALVLEPRGHEVRTLGEILGYDVTTVSLSDNPEPEYAALGRTDLVVGSPAVFANDEEASDDEEFVQAIEDLKPELFVLDTVRGLSGPRFEWFLEALCDDLADFGYNVGSQVVDLGGRRRTLIVGVRDRLPRFRAADFHPTDAAVTLASIISENLR